MRKNFYLSRDIAKFIKELEQTDSKPLYELTPQGARDFLVELQKKHSEEIEGVDFEDRVISTDYAGEVDVRIYRPKNTQERLPAIVYAHGGGWVLGDKETFTGFMKNLTLNAEAVVIFVDYSRSPEAHYPVALNQICGVIDYVYENPSEFNITPEKIVIAGDSAGGNMAAASAIKLKYESQTQLLGIALFYPVCSAEMNTNSFNNFKNGPWLTKKAMEYFFDAYEPDRRLREIKYISLLNAEIADLEGLPPTVIVTAENDVLRDEGEEFARLLDEAGVKVINFRANGTIHDFMLLNALQHTTQTKAILEFVCGELKKLFGQ